MAIEFLVDENMPGAVCRAVVRHNRLGVDLVNAQQVGDMDAPPKGTRDPELLIWTERESRLFISYDKKTLPDHFAAHLATGHHSPGVLIFKPRHTFPFIAEFLALVTHASTPEEWIDLLYYVD